MKTILEIFIVLLISYNISFSQQTTWQRIFGGPRNDYAYELFQTLDGNFLMLGEKAVVSLNTGLYIPQTYLVKFDNFGNKIWEKYYGDSIRANYSVSAIELPSGNVLIPYVNNNIGNLMNIDNNGNLIWDRHYPNPISGFYYIGLIDNNKNILINGDQIGGLSYIPNISKLDTNGNLFWTKGASDSAFKRGFYNSDLGYYSVGAKNNSSSYIDKRDTSGKLIWKRIINNPYGNNFFEFSSLTSVSPVTYIAIGKICNSNECLLFATKFDSSGNILWQKDYFNDSLYGFKIVKTLNNNFAISGGYNIGKNLLSIIDSTGNVLYKKIKYYNADNAIRYDNIINTSDSGFLVCGTFEITAEDYSDFLAIKADKNFNFNSVGIINNSSLVQDFEFKLRTFPNPFNPTIYIRLELNKSDIIIIKLFDINGKEIITISNEYLSSGINLLLLNANELNLTSGIYFLKAYSKKFSVINKIILLK
jgi:hypothetical protein